MYAGHFGRGVVILNGPNSRRSLHTSSNSLSRSGALIRHQGIPHPDPSQRMVRTHKLTNMYVHTQVISGGADSHILT